MPFALACPTCHADLNALWVDAQVCESCGMVYRSERGIWRFMTDEGEAAVRSFTERYARVRRDEGRRMVDAVRLEGLPFRGFSRKHGREWFIRSRSFEALVGRVVEPLERTHRARLRILDLGSGVGWLANRLALRGHEVAAIDIVTDDFGLGVHRHYRRRFLSIQADFDRLPLARGSADLVIFNASFHYAIDGLRALAEALRVLAVRGRVVIMDSPIYRDGSSGAAMVKEREDGFDRRYGVGAESVRSHGFLTYDALEALRGNLALRWAMHQPWYGLRWWAKPHMARLRGSREPAQFKLVVGQRLGES